MYIRKDFGLICIMYMYVNIGVLQGTQVIDNLAASEAAQTDVALERYVYTNVYVCVCIYAYICIYIYVYI
jgi:hypothetical protein